MGNKIATPFTAPSPGIAPMNNPTVTPMMMRARLSGWSDSKMPSARKDRSSIEDLGSGLGKISR